MSSITTDETSAAIDEPKGWLDRIACIETATRVSIALALTALIGRALTLLIDGPTPMKFLFVLLAIATAAFVAASMSRKKARIGSLWNARFSKMAQRVGIIQMVVSIVTVVLALA